MGWWWITSQKYLTLSVKSYNKVFCSSTSCRLTFLFPTRTHHKSQESSGEKDERGSWGVRVQRFSWVGAVKLFVSSYQCLLRGTSLTACAAVNTHSASLMSLLCIWFWTHQTQTWTLWLSCSPAFCSYVWRAGKARWGVKMWNATNRNGNEKILC